MSREESAQPVYPRAPSQEKWDAMSAEERRRVVDALPGEVTDAEMSPPEGDLHFAAKVDALDALREHYKRLKRRVYIASELPVYYPDERRFAPDVLVVFEVEAHARQKYVVSAEGKGLDVVFEIHVGGDRKKDTELNVERYARLRIPEYFIYDRARQKVLGYRLPETRGGKYVPIVPQQGRLPSQLLGLELAVEEGNLRFFVGNARVFETRELVEKLTREVTDVLARLEEEQRLREEEQRLREEEQRLREEEQRLREEEQRLREEEQRARAALEQRVAELEAALKQK